MKELKVKLPPELQHLEPLVSTFLTFMILHLRPDIRPTEVYISRPLNIGPFTLAVLSLSPSDIPLVVVVSNLNRTIFAYNEFIQVINTYITEFDKIIQVIHKYLLSRQNVRFLQLIPLSGVFYVGATKTNNTIVYELGFGVVNFTKDEVVRIQYPDTQSLYNELINLKKQLEDMVSSMVKVPVEILFEERTDKPSYFL